MRGNVAAWENVFQMLEEGRVHRHQVFKMAMLGAVLHHQDLAVALDDRSLDLTDFLVEQDLVRQLAVNNLLADFRYALWTERIRLPGPPEGRIRSVQSEIGRAHV